MDDKAQDRAILFYNYVEEVFASDGIWINPLIIEAEKKFAATGRPSTNPASAGAPNLRARIKKLGGSITFRPLEKK